MPGGNSDIVRRLYRAMNDGDLGAAAELAAPGAEWVSDDRLGMDPIHGREAVIRFFLDQAEPFEGLHVEPERFWELGDEVLAFIHLTGEGRASGAPFDIRIAHLWTVRDGLVIRGQAYGDRDEGLAAAGISQENEP